MELETQNKYFDRQYFKHNSSVSFKTLIEFAVNNNFMDKGHAEIIFSSYKDAVYFIIMATCDFDQEDDYDLKIKELSNKYYLALNDYLKSLNSPYEALSEIIKNSPKSLIYNSYDRFNYLENKINKKLGILNDKSKLLCENNFEYNIFNKNINNYLNILDNNQLLYPTLDNNSLKDISTLEKVNKTVDEYILELDILEKFNQKDILLLLKELTYSTDYRGVTFIAMNNYMFNSFFKDSSSIILTDNMRKIVIKSIQNSFISIDDAINVIENGDIKYDEDEKQYIIDKFIPVFENEIIEKKDYIPFVKIK